MKKRHFFKLGLPTVAGERGSSLVEALVALVILGFGLLAIGKFQITLAEAIGSGRDRIEATFLAQDEMDRLRSFDLLDTPTGTPTTSFGYDEVLTASSTVLSNSNYVAAFNRGVRVSANPVNLTWSGTTVTPDLKLVLVDLSWTDKRGNTRSLTLPSLIAKHDPSDAAWLIACQTDDSIRCGTKDVIKTPYNRSLRIPYPAKDLDGSKSVFAPPGSPTGRLIFDNDTGTIETICTDTGTDTTISDDVIDDITNGTYNSCTTVNGYLISGFIGGESTGNRKHSLSAAEIQSISMSMTITTGDPSVTCYDSSLTNTALDADNMISFACIVIPLDHDSSPLTSKIWSGTLNIAIPNVAFQSGNNGLKVCRFSFDSNGDNTISNEEHPATYTQVKSSLENQNFIIIAGACNETAREVPHQP